MGKKVKEHYNLEAAVADLKKRQDLYNKCDQTINGLFNSINANYNCMAITIPEDKKKILTKEIKAVDAWMRSATAELKDIREASGSMLPEDRVARTMDLQEDIAAKIEILKSDAATE